MATGSQGNESLSSANARVKAKVSPVRNVVGVVLLVVFGGTVIAEFLAYRGHSSALATLRALGPKIDGGPAKDKVEKAIGLAPPAKLKDEGGERSATYNWRGLVQTYKFKAFYTAADPPLLVRVETE